jgi:dGTPase
MANPREKREAIERTLVGQFGVRAENSKGRALAEPECDIRTCFQRDVDRITHCKAFRRLKHKTQVYLLPEGDHYRTRLTHTLEVSRLARTIARALELNEDLTEAMALGHDLGHTPFGHAGERALNKIYENGFKHYEQSLRVVDILERDGRGLNLCYETRMGILHHTHGAPDDTTEATVVRMADRIAYINHDLDDTIRAGILRAEDVPEMIRSRCGERNSVRINSIVSDLIENSGNGQIKMSDYMQEAVDFFHAFMYSDVYTNPIAKSEESKVDGIIGGLFDYYTAHPEKMPDEMKLIAEREGTSRAVCDFISGMTDGYAMEKYSEAFIPMSWTVK